MFGWISVVGAGSLDRLGRLGRAGVFFARAAACCLTPPLKGDRILQQIWFIGGKSTLVICLTGLFTGMVLALQGFPTLRKVGSEAFLGPLVGFSLLRELGPVLAALMATGRAGSAITAKIGMMRTNEQIDALSLMGLNPLRYLVVPNLVAGLVALPLLTAIFNVVALFGSYLVAVRLLGLNSGTFFGEMHSYLRLSDVLGGTYKGYHSGFGAEGVSRATTEGVVTASVLILVWDYVMTSFLF